MSWSGISNNQIVSNANLDDAITTSVFRRRSTFTANNLELTKARAQAYAYLNENYASFYAKTNDQLVAKQDLQAATIINCGTGTYGNILWTANTLTKTTAFFDVGTASGTLTIDYVVNAGSASIAVVYGGTSTTITSLVSSNGSATYSYTYNSSYGTIIGITFDTRSNSAVTQNFNVRSSCGATYYYYTATPYNSSCVQNGAPGGTILRSTNGSLGGSSSWVCAGGIRHQIVGTTTGPTYAYDVTGNVGYPNCGALSC